MVSLNSAICSLLVMWWSCALETGSPRASDFPDDRDQELAHQVAAEDQGVDLVELRGVQELPIGRLRAVDIAGVEEARGFSARFPFFQKSGIRSPPNLVRELTDVPVPLLPVADHAPASSSREGLGLAHDAGKGRVHLLGDPSLLVIPERFVRGPPLSDLLQGSS